MAKTSTILIDSHYIKNNHLTIWPVLSNQEKQHNINREHLLSLSHKPGTALYFSQSSQPWKQSTTQQKRDVLAKKVTVESGKRIKTQNQASMTPKFSALFTLLACPYNIKWKSDLSITFHVCKWVTTSLHQLFCLQDARVSIADFQSPLHSYDSSQPQFYNFQVKDSLYAFLNKREAIK